MTLDTRTSAARTTPWPALIPVGALAGRPAIPLARPVTLVGSRNSANLRIQSSTISKAHALILNSDGKLYIRDLASRTGVFVNARQVREADLTEGDLVKIGRFTFKYTAGPTSRVSRKRRPAPAGRLELEDGTSIALDQRVMLIGHRESADVPLMDQSVSTAHAAIFEMNGKRYVRDLGSRSGTFINNHPSPQMEIRPGDTIRVGETMINYVADQQAAGAAAAEPTTPRPGRAAATTAAAGGLAASAAAVSAAAKSADDDFLSLIGQDDESKTPADADALPVEPAVVPVGRVPETTPPADDELAALGLDEPTPAAEPPAVTAESQPEALAIEATADAATAAVPVTPRQADEADFLPLELDEPASATPAPPAEMAEAHEAPPLPLDEPEVTNASAAAATLPILDTELPALDLEMVEPPAVALPEPTPVVAAQAEAALDRPTEPQADIEAAAPLELEPSEQTTAPESPAEESGAIAMSPVEETPAPGAEQPPAPEPAASEADIFNFLRGEEPAPQATETTTAEAGEPQLLAPPAEFEPNEPTDAEPLATAATESLDVAAATETPTAEVLPDLHVADAGEIDLAEPAVNEGVATEATAAVELPEAEAEGKLVLPVEGSLPTEEVVRSKAVLDDVPAVEPGEELPIEAPSAAAEHPAPDPELEPETRPEASEATAALPLEVEDEPDLAGFIAALEAEAHEQAMEPVTEEPEAEAPLDQDLAVEGPAPESSPESIASEAVLSAEVPEHQDELLDEPPAVIDEAALSVDEASIEPEIELPAEQTPEPFETPSAVELLDAPAAHTPSDEAESLDNFAGELVRGLEEEPVRTDEPETPSEAITAVEEPAAPVEETPSPLEEPTAAEPLAEQLSAEPVAPDEPVSEPLTPAKPTLESAADETGQETVPEPLSESELVAEPPPVEAPAEPETEEQAPSFEVEPSAEAVRPDEADTPLELQEPAAEESIDVTSGGNFEPPSVEETDMAALELTPETPVMEETPPQSEAPPAELVFDEPALDEAQGEESGKPTAPPVASDDVLAFLDLGEEPGNSDDSMVGETVVPRLDTPSALPAEPSADAHLHLSTPSADEGTMDVTATPVPTAEEIEASLTGEVISPEASPPEPPAPSVVPAPPPAAPVGQARPKAEPPMKIQFFSAPGGAAASGGLVTMTLPAGPGGVPALTPPAPQPPAAPKAGGAPPLKFVSVGDASSVTVTLPTEGPATPRGPGVTPPPRQAAPPPGMVITSSPAAFSGAPVPQPPGGPTGRPTAVAVPRGATLKGRPPGGARLPPTAAPLVAAQDDVFVGVATGTPENVRVEPTKQPKPSGMDFISATGTGGLMDDDDDDPRDVFSMGAAGVIEHEQPAGPGVGIQPVQELTRPQPAKGKGPRGPIIPPKVPGWGAPQANAPAPQPKGKPGAKGKEQHWPTLPEPQPPGAPSQPAALQRPASGPPATSAPPPAAAPADSDISFDDLFGPGGLMGDPASPGPASVPVKAAPSANVVRPKPASSPSPDATDYDLDSLLTSDAKDKVAAQPEDVDLVDGDFESTDAGAEDAPEARREGGGRSRRVLWLLVILAGVLAAVFIIYKYFPATFLAEGGLIYERGAQASDEQRAKLLAAVRAAQAIADQRVQSAPAPSGVVPAGLLSWVAPRVPRSEPAVAWVPDADGRARLRITISGSDERRDRAWLEELLQAAYKDRINQELRAEALELAARRDLARSARDEAKGRLQAIASAVSGMSEAIKGRPAPEEIAAAQAAEEKLLQELDAAVVARHALAAEIERMQSAGAAAAGQPAVSEKDDPVMRELVARTAELQGRLAGAKDAASQSAGKEVEETRRAAQEKQREYEDLVARAASLKGDPVQAELVAGAQKYQQDNQQFQQTFLGQLERPNARLRDFLKKSQERQARHVEQLIANDPDLKDLRQVEQEKQKQLLAAEQNNLTRDVRIIRGEIDKLKENMAHRRLVLSTDPHSEEMMGLVRAMIEENAKDAEAARLALEKQLNESDAAWRRTLSKTQGMTKEQRELAEQLERKAEAMRAANKAFNDLAAKHDQAAGEQVRQIEAELTAAQEKVAARRKELSTAQQTKLSDAQAAQLQPKREQLAEMDKMVETLRQQKLASATRLLELDRRQRSADDAEREHRRQQEQQEAAKASVERLESELAAVTKVLEQTPSALSPAPPAITQSQDRRPWYVIGALVVALLLSAVGTGGRSETRTVHVESARE